MRPKLFVRTVLGCSSLALAGALLWATPARAATFTVDTTEDTADTTQGDGQCATAAGNCSLRAAIQEANKLPGADVILLPAGTYLIAREGEDDDRCASGDLDITSAVSLNGDGAATTIVDANHRDRVFDVRPTGAAVITGVTIQNGSAKDGGGIRVEGGTAKLARCAVTGNQAADNGGGIDNDFGVLELSASTVAGNVAHNAGGGIANSGTATVRNTTVSGNTADIVGGGVCNLGTTTLQNATVTANTLAGVDNDGQLVFLNSLLADNAGPDCQGTLTSRGFNLIRNIDGCTFDGDTSGDLINRDARLGPLQDNGGPTFTHALLEGSAALDTANPAAPGTEETSCETTDQRGVARPQGPRCDIGAFEACDALGSPGGALCIGTCGDGTVDSAEECDDGAANGTEGDPCDATCRLVVPAPGDQTGPRCGDGIVDHGEECDDHNHLDDDGCSATCELEAPLTCDDDDEEDSCVEDEGDCDARQRFKDVNCVLESPMCEGESLPIGIVKRIAKARDALGAAWRAENPRRGKRFVGKAVRMLKKAERIRSGVDRKGGISPECAAALRDVLGQAKDKCKRWRRSF